MSALAWRSAVWAGRDDFNVTNQWRWPAVTRRGLVAVRMCVVALGGIRPPPQDAAGILALLLQD